MFSDIPNREPSSNIVEKDTCTSDCKFSSKSSEPYHATQPNVQRLSKLKPFEPSSEYDEETEASYWGLSEYILATVIILGAIKYIHSTFQNQNEKTNPLLTQYLEEIEKIKPNYDGQTDEFWNVIRAFPYYHLSDENPEGPAVLLIVTPAGSLNLASKLTQQLAVTYNKLLDSDSKILHFIEGTSLMDQNPDIQKIAIDEQIRTFVGDHGQRAVVVVNLEKIDPKAIMIFHAYCDNTEAVYKNIAIIFLVELPAGVDAKNKEDAYAYLSKIWSPLGQSKIQALLSRVANNIAILKEK